MDRVLVWNGAAVMDRSAQTGFGWSGCHGLLRSMLGRVSASGALRGPQRLGVRRRAGAVGVCVAQAMRVAALVSLGGAVVEWFVLAKAGRGLARVGLARRGCRDRVAMAWSTGRSREVRLSGHELLRRAMIREGVATLSRIGCWDEDGSATIRSRRGGRGPRSVCVVSRCTRSAAKLGHGCQGKTRRCERWIDTRRYEEAVMVRYGPHRRARVGRAAAWIGEARLSRRAKRWWWVGGRAKDGLSWWGPLREATGRAV